MDIYMSVSSLLPSTYNGVLFWELCLFFDIVACLFFDIVACLFH